MGAPRLEASLGRAQGSGSGAGEVLVVVDAPRGGVVAGQPADHPVAQRLAEPPGLTGGPPDVLAGLVLVAGDLLQDHDRIEPAAYRLEPVAQHGVVAEVGRAGEVFNRLVGRSR